SLQVGWILGLTHSSVLRCRWEGRSDGWFRPDLGLGLLDLETRLDCGNSATLPNLRPDNMVRN
ncbi:uncharacterized protein METZ01_LOCUS397673, partial [marine metagenome]